MLILDDLWYGNIAPCDRTFRPDSEYGRQMQKISDADSAITAELSEAGKLAFEAFQNASNIAASIALSDSFASGFRTGVLMMIDVFQPTSVKGLEPL